MGALTSAVSSNLDKTMDSLLTSNIPDEFKEDVVYDKYNRLLAYVFLYQNNDTYIKVRLANLKQGYLFKIIHNPITFSMPTTITEEELKTYPLYIALEDCKYNPKSKQVSIKCALHVDFIRDITLNYIPVINSTPVLSKYYDDIRTWGRTLCRGKYANAAAVKAKFHVS